LLFNSGEFFVLLGATLLLYPLLARRGQNRMLLVASWVFYAWWDWRFLGLLWLSTIVDFLAARGIEAARARGDAAAPRRWLAASLATNLGALGFFKYWNFFAESTARVLEALGLHASPLTLHVILPAGISFYTFQTLAYTIDVWRGRVRAERDPLDFALFVAFFPQLMAGPIERARRLLPQIRRPRTVTAEDWRVGGWLLFWGLFKKVFIADNLAPLTGWAFHVAEAPSAAQLASVYFGFAIQFYCDFSGYSDMARGIARLFGIQIANNFRLPYFSPNPMALWQRWHRTLAFWFRDYVYGPLSRALGAGPGRAAAALATMGLVGLWHGAAFTFVLWGLAWGVVLVVHRLVRGPIARFVQGRPWARPWRTMLGTLLTFYLWLTLGTFFVAPDAGIAARFLWRFHTGFDSSPGALRDFATVLYYSAPLVAMQIAQLRAGKIDLVPDWPAPVRFAVYAGLTLLLVVMGAEADQEFFYFAF